MSEILKFEQPTPEELARRQDAAKKMDELAGELKGSGLSSVKLVREARQAAEDRVRRFSSRRP